MNQLEQGKMQAALKNLLNRSQSSTDIETSELSESTPAYNFDQLLAEAKASNPDIAGMQKMVERQGLQIDLAKKDFYPDFNVQGMWQRTDPSQYRAYYQFTVGMRIPIYRSRKQRPELAQAESDRDRAKSELEMQSQQTAFQLRQQFISCGKISGATEDLSRRLDTSSPRRATSGHGRVPIQSPGLPGLAGVFPRCPETRRRILADAL